MLLVLLSRQVPEIADSSEERERERENNIWKSRYLLSSTNSDTLWVKQIRLKKKDKMGVFVESYY
jgi:hypothetical protein